MKLNQLPNFRVEDFDSEKSWIGKFFTQLNPFVQSVNQVLDQNVDYATNIKSVTRSYTITQFLPFSFQWPFKDQAPVDLRVTQASKGTQLTPTILLAAWEYDASQLLVSVTRMSEVNAASLSGLTGRYVFTVRASV